MGRKRKFQRFAVDDNSDSSTSAVHIPSSQFHSLPTGDLCATSLIFSIPPPASQEENERLEERLELQPSDDLSLYRDEDPPLIYEAASEIAHNSSHVDHPDVNSEMPGVKRPSNNPLNQWLNNRDSFLAEEMRWEGRMDYPQECGWCSAEPAHYRCIDCEGGELVCKSCIIKVHRCNGLHRIEMWTGSFFQKVTLKALGFRFQLGHLYGDRCLVPQPLSADDFVVVDINGIHEVAIDFCNCETAQLHFIQLLRFRWLPTTTSYPKSAATFRVLKHFQMLSFESKLSGFEFYNELARISDNIGIHTPKDRYPSFMTMIRMYRHIKMLKRSGRGHDRKGVTATELGGCAVLCPACPQPGLNLPEGWEDVAPEKRFLYCLFLAIDANFRLKRKYVSNDNLDPGLGSGWAYFVAEEPFKRFLKDFGDLKQAPSTCSNHKAVDTERSAAGLAATGVGAIDCARHDIKRPVSVGDLQKGERYVNMDYLFFSSIQGTGILELVVSYDIVCQWSIHLWKRMQMYPRSLHVDPTNKKKFRFLIPKFHLPAHIMACQTVFSFNYNRHVGRTDGEAPEQGWSHINPVATSTREMGPGARRDTLDDHFGDWNWKKTILMGASLLRKIKVAISEQNEHQALHTQFELSLPGDSIAKWKMELAAWEIDHQKPNPYESRFKTLTQDAVRRALATQEANEMMVGSAYVMHEEVSASQLITMGLDIEEQQRRLAINIKNIGPYATDNQKTKVQVDMNILRRKIMAWIDVQHLYVPSLRVIRIRTADSLPDHQAEERCDRIQLFLPSSLPPSVCYDTRLLEIEWRLRNAQANDALDELRHSLRLRSYLYMDKDRFQRGQSANTRSRTIIDRVRTKVDAAATKYRVACAALTSLAGPLGQVGWETAYPQLNPTDIRGLSDPEGERASKRGTGSEGHRRLSWIWTRLGDGSLINSDDGLQDGLRIEWCKSRARASRWSEEVCLLQEEMRRVIAFLEARAIQWIRRSIDIDWVVGFPGQTCDPATTEGRLAYALQQAAQFRAIKQHFEVLWHDVDMVPDLSQAQ